MSDDPKPPAPAAVGPRPAPAAEPLQLHATVSSGAQFAPTLHGPPPTSAREPDATAAAAPGVLVPGQRLAGRYVVTRRLAAGAMGTVYEAQHEGLRSRVALKVMHAQLAKDPALLARFRREAAVMAKLNHHRAVRVLDSGEEQDQLFLVMEFVEGDDVDRLLAQRGRLPLEQVSLVAEQLLEVLAVAHQLGIVHRDLKPANLLLVTKDGKPELKVADFGIAALQGAGADLKATATGQFAGTPAYVSPEQCRGEKVDGRSDLYSAGCLLFELLTGKPPFTQTNVADLFAAHLFRAPPRLADVAPDLQVPPELEAVLQQALAKQADARFPTAEAMAEAWRAAVAPQAKRVRADAAPVQRPAAGQGTPVAVYAPSASAAEREGVLQALAVGGFAAEVVDGAQPVSAAAAVVLAPDAAGVVAAAKALGQRSPGLRVVAVLPLGAPGALEAVLDAGLFAAVDSPADPVELARKLARAARQGKK